MKKEKEVYISTESPSAWKNVTEQERTSLENGNHWDSIDIDMAIVFLCSPLLWNIQWRHTCI